MMLSSFEQAWRGALVALLFLPMVACNSKDAPAGTAPDPGRELPDASLAGGDADGGDAGPSVVPEACTGTLKSLREVVFAASCGTAGCHTGKRPSENLDFNSKDLLTRLVGIPSLRCGDQMLIDPGHPDDSLLVAKLEGTMPKDCGKQMPLGLPALPDEHIACVRAWIETLEPISGPLCTYCDLDCVDLDTDSDHCGTCDNACDGDRACEKGVCECQAPLIECDGKCVDPASDDAHCGGCDRACPAASACAESECLCLAGNAAVCDGACVDVESDASRCGDCDTQCPAFATCAARGCECADSLELCDGACVDLQSDADHCGTCEIDCSEGEVCLEGHCAQDCGTLTRCGDACVDVATSILHCVDCDQPCAIGAACNGEACECPSGEEVCDGECTDLESDEARCGDCDTACAGEEQCLDGDCGCATDGETSCSGACVDLNSDEAFCGDCLISCKGEEQCIDGDCACPDAGDTSCSGVCVDLDTDKNNCGACGEGCNPGEVCIDKNCECSSAAVSFGSDVEPLLVDNCTNSNCHDNITQKKGLNLSEGQAFASLVDIDSGQCPEAERKRVAPGSIENSYLIDKLLGVRMCGDPSVRMPNMGEPLTPSEMDTIARWICQGADND